ncbi:MAG: hypothetical protein SGJ18_02810 [Pseudomonadota bacterium]|nr:hypothetical protein [Pseudomonadota bacterium]
MRLLPVGLIASLVLLLASCTGEKPLRPKARNKSLIEFKQDLLLEKDPTKKFYIHADIVKKYSSEPMTSSAAIEAESFSKSLLEIAKNYEKDWNYGNAIHHGNLVLGRVKLFQGDLTVAKQYLILAAGTNGSPQLGSFGPNMTLAKELLEKGEKKAVLEYFDNCLKFWKSPTAKTEVEPWKTAINKGSTPDFGGNLVY